MSRNYKFHNSEATLFTKLVAEVINELQKGGEIPTFSRNDDLFGGDKAEEIPPFSRNDDQSGGGKGGSNGGEAAIASFPSILDKPVIPNETQCSEESLANSEIDSNSNWQCSANLHSLQIPTVMPALMRNLLSYEKLPVIPTAESNMTH